MVDVDEKNRQGGKEVRQWLQSRQVLVIRVEGLKYSSCLVTVNVQFAHKNTAEKVKEVPVFGVCLHRLHIFCAFKSVQPEISGQTFCVNCSFPLMCVNIPDLF